MLSGDASFTQAWIPRSQKVSRGFIKRERTRRHLASDDDEPEVAYTNEPLADKNWRAQYEADRERNKNSTVLRSVQGLKKRTVPGFYDVLPQLRLASFERCVHKFPDFRKCLSSSGDKRKRRKLFWRNSLTNTK